MCFAPIHVYAPARRPPRGPSSRWASSPLWMAKIENCKIIFHPCYLMQSYSCQGFPSTREWCPVDMCLLHNPRWWGWFNTPSGFARRIIIQEDYYYYVYYYYMMYIEYHILWPSWLGVGPIPRIEFEPWHALLLPRPSIYWKGNAGLASHLW